MQSLSNQLRRLFLCGVIVMSGVGLNASFSSSVAWIGTALVAGTLYYLNGRYEESLST